MTDKSFPPQLFRGVEVAAASARSEILLAVREGFVRYFHQGLGRETAVAVVAHEASQPPLGVAASGAEMVERCQQRAAELEQRLDQDYQFYVAVDEGLETLSLESGGRHLVRTWAVVRGLGGTSCGGSGSFELPARLLSEGMTGADGRRKMAGMRRRRALVEALSGGLESRRSSAAEAVFNALAALFYDAYSGHPKSGG